MPETSQYVLGADAGTHGVRILALRLPDCTVAARSICGYRRRVGDGVQELDAKELERAFFEALHTLELPQGARVAALGITHQRGTVIPVDAGCVPLAPAFCDSDERALDAAGYRAEGLDPGGYYQRSGCPVVSFNGFSKILWCRRYRRELFDRTAAWLSPQDYLLSHLTGTLQMTEGSALRSGILDIQKRELACDLLFDAPFLRLPLTAVGASCGEADRSVVRKFPVLERALLFAVPGDQPAAVLGAGAAVPNAAAINLGTTFVVSAVSGSPVKDPEGLVTTEVLPGGLYAPEFGTGAGGQFMDFLTALLYGSVPDSEAKWAEIDGLAAGTPAGAQGLRIVPLLWQAASAGIEGCMSGLRPFHTRRHFFRAAYEGLTYETLLSLTKLSAWTDTCEVLRVFGGLSRQPGFLQILASVTGKRVEAVGETQASALGAGLTCALGLGAVRSAGALPDISSAHRRTLYPNKEERLYYEQAFQEYCTRRKPISEEFPA